MAIRQDRAGRDIESKVLRRELLYESARQDWIKAYGKGRLKMLRPEDWEKFRREPANYRISYLHNTYLWARRRGWIKNEGLFATLYAVLAATFVVVIFSLIKNRFDLSPGYLFFAIPLALFIGANRGSRRAVNRAFTARLASSEQAFHDALREGGLDIYAPGEFE